MELVRRTHEAVRRADWQTAMAAYSRDTEWDDRELRPEGAVHRGFDAMRQEMRIWFGAWVDYDWKIERVVDAGADVLVIGREVGRAKGTGVPMDQRVALVHTVRDGLITRTRVFRDPAHALEAVGLSE